MADQLYSAENYMKISGRSRIIDLFNHFIPIFKCLTGNKQKIPEEKTAVQSYCNTGETKQLRLNMIVQNYEKQ